MVFYVLHLSFSPSCQGTEISARSRTTPVSVVHWLISYLFTLILLHIHFGSQGDASAGVN